MTATTTAVDPVGRECLSVTVRADWAHFRRVDTTTDKQTYRVIPRTTVAGLLAAAVGAPRDTYYDAFAPDVSAVAVVPETPVRTMAVPQLTLPTKEADVTDAPPVGGEIVKPSVTAGSRQRRTFEYLCDPAYTIHLVAADDWIDRLADRLDPRPPSTPATDHDPAIRPVYTLSLGKSECLAEVTDCVRSTVRDTETDVNRADSIVPESALVPAPDATFQVERTPAYMTATDDGRKTTEFVSYGFDSDGGSVPADPDATATVAGDTVVFV
jgi:CRISPR-associated protein Cas5h